MQSKSKTRRARPSKKTAAKAGALRALPDPTPATPEEMSAEVIEFITAIDTYKRPHRRPFPNWSEVLRILKALGYERAS